MSVHRGSILAGPQAATSRTHAIGLEWMPERQELMGIATFFNEMTYGVRLGHNPTAEWSGLCSGHSFDPRLRRIATLHRQS